MKTPFLALLLASPLPLSATVVYSGEQNLAVAWDDLEGVYVNVATGATAVVWPEDFDNAPWINLTLGGYGIFNSELVKPWGLSGGESYDPEQETDYYLNLEEGTIVDSSGPFLESAWGSQFHVEIAAEPGKFLVGEDGFFGFSFKEELAGIRGHAGTRHRGRSRSRTFRRPFNCRPRPDGSAPTPRLKGARMRLQPLLPGT